MHNLLILNLFLLLKDDFVVCDVLKKQILLHAAIGKNPNYSPCKNIENHNYIFLNRIDITFPIKCKKCLNEYLKRSCYRVGNKISLPEFKVFLF